MLENYSQHVHDVGNQTLISRSHKIKYFIVFEVDKIVSACHYSNQQTTISWFQSIVLKQALELNDLCRWN